MTSTPSTPTKRILVTGDYGSDYEIYLHSKEDNPPPGIPPAQVRVTIGGAGIELRILSAASAQLASAKVVWAGERNARQSWGQ